MGYQASIFDIIPQIPYKLTRQPIYDASWDEKETAPEHRASVREPVAVNTCFSLRDDNNIEVRVSKETAENFAPEQIEDSQGDKAPQSPSLLDECVREQNQVEAKTAPEQICESWNPDDFGEVPFKCDGDQLTVFYDDSHEPPDPDDFNSIKEYEQAWNHWEQSVREQTDLQPLQAAPEHSGISSNEVAQITNHLLDTGVREQLLQASQKVQSSYKPNQTQKCNHWVEVYWVRRTGKKHYYYRYCWMEGRKIRRLHIGSISSGAAKEKSQETKTMIVAGKDYVEVIEFLRS